MIDAELNVLPSMADNMRVSSDGLTYLFRLREGVRWSDGEPLTADDFAFTWMRMRELETRTAFLMEDVETAEALDDRTLEITLREPRSFFPTFSPRRGPSLAAAQAASSSGRTGTGRRTSSPTARSRWPSSTTSTRS